MILEGGLTVVEIGGIHQMLLFQDFSLPPQPFHRGSYFRSHWEALLRPRGHRLTGLCLSNDLSADTSKVPGLPCPASFRPSLQNILRVNVHCRVALSQDILAS